MTWTRKHIEHLARTGKIRGFNDKLIRKGIVETEQVPKGSEYFEFELLTFKK